MKNGASPPAPAKPGRVIALEFAPKRDDMAPGKELRDGLSVALQIGDTLWVANDESVSLERLSLEGQRSAYRHARRHKQFLLADYLRLPAPETAGEPPGEIDIEGLDQAGGYLWLVGSHSLKRPLPSPDAKDAHKRLATLSADGNRYLLARVPVVDDDGSPGLAKKVRRKGDTRTAAQLRGNAKGNDLTRGLRGDKHLGPFLQIPGKDNGFDIEGLAVAGRRVFLGLRGPVLRGWAVILEVEPRPDSKRASVLTLKPIGPSGRSYRKHLLDLGGLGVRDLCVQGDDLLILAGPTMALDGPVRVLRWRGGAKPEAQSAVTATQLERVLELPYGQGVDHAEGICLFAREGAAPSLLVVYDSAAESRQSGKSSLAADVFALPRKH